MLGLRNCMLVHMMVHIMVHIMVHMLVHMLVLHNLFSQVKLEQQEQHNCMIMVKHMKLQVVLF
jgi:hypothetical protein